MSEQGNYLQEVFGLLRAEHRRLERWYKFFSFTLISDDKPLRSLVLYFTIFSISLLTVLVAPVYTTLWALTIVFGPLYLLLFLFPTVGRFVMARMLRRSADRFHTLALEAEQMVEHPSHAVGVIEYGHLYLFPYDGSLYRIKRPDLSWGDASFPALKEFFEYRPDAATFEGLVERHGNCIPGPGDLPRVIISRYGTQEATTPVVRLKYVVMNINALYSTLVVFVGSLLDAVMSLPPRGRLIYNVQIDAFERTVHAPTDIFMKTVRYGRRKSKTSPVVDPRPYQQAHLAKITIIDKKRYSGRIKDNGKKNLWCFVLPFDTEPLKPLIYPDFFNSSETQHEVPVVELLRPFDPESDLEVLVDPQ